MKIYIKSATTKYSIEDFKTIAEEVNSTACNNGIAEAVLEADTQEYLKHSHLKLRRVTILNLQMV